MKKVYVFNNMFLKFLDFLETISLETHAEIFLVKTVLKTKNKEELIEYFEIYCLPFKNELKNCNEEFFLNHNIQNKFNELFSIFTKRWNELNKQQKAVVFYYFHKLIDICEKK